MTLARQNRLPAKEISSVKKHSRVFHSDSFSLLYSKTTHPVSRFAFIVSTKVSPNASARSKARRALSEGVRRCLFELSTSFDCLLIARPSITKSYTSDIMKEVHAAFLKAKLINQ